MKRLLWVLALVALPGCMDRRLNPAPSESEPLVHRAIRIPGSIEHTFQPPHVLLAHSDALQLTNTQSTEILELTNTARAQLTSSDADLNRTTEALRVALRATPIDEEAAIQAAREVSAVEDEIKLIHLRMLIRVQNTLTPQQREMARSYAVP